ncbi:hypothetical protein [Solirubrobacter soli]|uniref:hypothetical protein n=1 Tax=Solirubrobacter soli TaxID=363832 RepID=UPI00041145AF|nr:hypothetical protein [Solirubrobacter soli]
MNVITDTLRQIVRRKLWPVALVLLGALVAVPLLLAKEPESTALAEAANAKKVEPLPATFVSAPQPAENGKRRRVLGALKDPFEPEELPKVKKVKAKAAKDDAQSTPTTDTPSSDGSGGALPPVSAAPTATPAPTVTIPAYSVKVRFGTTDSDELPVSTIERLSVLPDEKNPVIVYRGVVDNGKAAIFELTGEVEAEGDAKCSPTPEDCQYIKLRAGETEFLTIADTNDEATNAQFQLDLVKVYKKQTKEKVSDPNATATQSLAKASSSSLTSKRFPLRRRNRYVFDATTGLLHLAPKGAKTPLSSL